MCSLDHLLVIISIILHIGNDVWHEGIPTPAFPGITSSKSRILGWCGWVVNDVVPSSRGCTMSDRQRTHDCDAEDDDNTKQQCKTDSSLLAVTRRVHQWIE